MFIVQRWQPWEPTVPTVLRLDKPVRVYPFPDVATGPVESHQWTLSALLTGPLTLSIHPMKSEFTG